MPRFAISRAVTIVTALLLAVPATLRAQLAVLSSTVEETVARPGTRYAANIVITNASSQPQTARIYQTDYAFLADGTSSFDEPGSNRRSNARWVAPQATRVVVPAGSRISVPYSVNVPADTSLRGTYWSTVMVEGLATEGTAGADSRRMALGTVMRYAIQVATHIESTGARALKFDAPSAGATATGAATLEFDLVNTGERAFRPLLWAELVDADGQLRAKSRQQRGLLYPTTSLHQVFEFGAIKPGTYKVVVYADTGAEPVFATQFSITW